MELGFFSLLCQVDLIVIFDVDLFLNVLLHLGCNLGLVGHFVVQGSSSLDGAVIISPSSGRFFFVEVSDGYPVGGGVYCGVVHDVLDPLLKLHQFVPIGRAGEIFS